MVRYKNRWMTIENAETEEMTGKGLVKYQNKWMKPEDKERKEKMDQGLVFYKGEWMTPERREQLQIAAQLGPKAQYATFAKTVQQIRLFLTPGTDLQALSLARALEFERLNASYETLPKESSALKSKAEESHRAIGLAVKKSYGKNKGMVSDAEYMEHLSMARHRIDEFLDDYNRLE
jgi:hypothetical protein